MGVLGKLYYNKNSQQTGLFLLLRARKASQSLVARFEFQFLETSHTLFLCFPCVSSLANYDIHIMYYDIHRICCMRKHGCIKCVRPR